MGKKATDQLRQVLVPDLQHAVGDPQTHLVTADLVLRYLQQHQLVFAEQTVRSMFAEADFKKDGGLSLGPLIAALQGRFPKRQYGQKDWLALVSVVLRRPLPELENMLARPERGHESRGANGMDVETMSHASGTTNPKKAFTIKPVTGEWASLVRAASQQAFATGSRPSSALSSRSAALQSTAPAAMQAASTASAVQHIPSASRATSAGRSTPHFMLPETAMQSSAAHTLAPSTTVQFRDNMGSMAMSIDTPSYANSLGLGQPGLQSRFVSNAAGLVQDPAQSMSIDGDAGMQPWDTFKPGATFASHNKMSATMRPSAYDSPIMIMTTRGPRCLDQTVVEEGINADIRQGRTSFASQQQFQQHAVGMQIMSDMTSTARQPMPKVRH